MGNSVRVQVPPSAPDEGLEGNLSHAVHEKAGGRQGNSPASRERELGQRVRRSPALGTR